MLIILLTLIGLSLYVLIGIILSIGFERLGSAFTAWEFRSSLLLSLIAAFTSTIIATPIAIFLAYIISRNKGLTSILVESILTIPFTMTPVAVGSLVLIFLLKTPLGNWLNAFFNFLFSLNGAILAQFILSLSAMITPLVETFESISIEYENVSRTLGHGIFSTFIYVVLPMAKRGVISSVLIGFTKAFSDFGATVMLAGAIIGRTATLPAAIYVEMNSGNIELAFAMILLSLIVSFIIGFATRLWRG
ncbi:molybdate ABC transporter permease subunit [Thermogladius sp. 4427co]|uniref:molybdate ABC transporter permease subunit n=1 Tax=Thermogladius sp. 4427co TaxID=3450718 RepID=UPI003F7AA7BB